MPSRPLPPAGGAAPEKAAAPADSPIRRALAATIDADFEKTSLDNVLRYIKAVCKDVPIEVDPVLKPRGIDLTDRLVDVKAKGIPVQDLLSSVLGPDLIAKVEADRVLITARPNAAAPAATSSTSIAAKAAEPLWGEAAQGVQVRLRADKAAWKAGETPGLLADVRNQAEGEMFVYASQDTASMEVDGQWYNQRPGPRADLKTAMLAPGKETTDVAFTLSDSWWKENGAPLALAPGKHKVRVALTADEVPRNQKAVFTVKSNPVEIEILPAAAEAMAGTPAQGRAFDEKRELAVAAPEPEEPAWGEAVGAAQVRLAADKPQWKAGEAPSIVILIRNKGSGSIILNGDQGLDLEVNGKWYQRPGNVGVKSGASLRVQSLGVWFILKEKWVGKDGGAELVFAPGKHTLRVALTTVPDPNKPDATARAISNPAEIEILSAAASARGS